MKQEIKTLTDREKCRLRMPVFFGSFDSRDMAFIETLMNARDELKNHCDWEGYIYVSLDSDNKTMTIEDNGRGIPLSDVGADGERNYVKLFETLFAGCNFDNATSEEIIESIGQNGVGSCCTAYNSIYYQATEYKNFIAREVTYTDGCLNREYREYESEKEHGTKIVFTLDDRTFTNVVFDPEYLRQYIKKISSTTNDIHYYFEYNGEKEELFYDNINDYFEEVIENNVSKTIHFSEKQFEIDGKKDGQSFVEKDRIELLLSLSTEPVQETYLNGGYLEENGTFYNGIIDGLRKFIQKNISDKKVKLTIQDIEMSFNIYGVMSSNNPVYSNQTKKAASNELYKKLASDYVAENMEIYKAENPQDFEKIAKHLQQINTFNNKNENAIKNIKKKLNTGDKILSKVKGLYECQSKDISKNVLCICEGKSALSGILENRPETCAILPIRGKILNCLKASPEKIVNCEIIASMINALGCGANLKLGKKTISKFNKENIRYSGLWLVCDADYDGIGSIVPLVLTVIYKLMPDLLLDGFVYICETPKYEIKFNDDTEDYAFDDNELREKLENETRKYELHYIKGLAELSETAMRRCLSGECNNIKQLSLNDAEKAIKELELWMGSDVEPRKQYILDNFDKGVVMGE